MITEQDLREAIAECQGNPHPNANTCIKLAAYYTILDNMVQTPKNNTGYSYTPAPTISYSGSELSRLVQAKSIEKVFPILDELVETLSVINPRLYNSVIQKISEL